MAQGMGDRLAEPMKEYGAHLKSWLPLFRSDISLGERIKARAAVDNAYRGLDDDLENSSELARRSRVSDSKAERTGPRP
jgi:hypothetical protein